MHDHKSTSCSLGRYFVQFQKNISYHKIIGRTPYKALFGVDPKVQLSSENLPRDLLDSVENKDDFMQLDLWNIEHENVQKMESNNQIEIKVLSKDLEENIDAITFTEENIIEPNINAAARVEDSLENSVSETQTEKLNNADGLDICLM